MENPFRTGPQRPQAGEEFGMEHSIQWEAFFFLEQHSLLKDVAPNMQNALPLAVHFNVEIKGGKLMPKFMLASTALCRLVEDASAPVGARVRALRQLDHPTLALLRRLLVDTDKRAIPVPSRLLAVAALKYAHEVQLRKIKASKSGRRPRQASAANVLGI
jgi:hypothetical protein